MKVHTEGAESSGGRGAGHGLASLWRPRVTRIAALPRRHPKAARIVLLVCVFFCGFSLFPRQESFRVARYRLGTVQPRTVIAGFDFAINKDPEILEQEQQAAMAAVPRVLVYHDSVEVKALAALERLRITIRGVRENQVPDEPYQESDVALSQNTYVALLTLNAEAIFLRARARLEELFERGIIAGELERQMDGTEPVTLLIAGVDWVGPSKRFMGPAKLRQEFARLGETPAEEQALAELVESFAWPNVTYDPEATQQRRDLARAAVDRSVGRVLKGEKIIGAHERITPEKLRVLESYEYWRERKASHLFLREQLLASLGRGLLLALLLAGFLLYLVAYRRDIVFEMSDALLLSLTFAGFCLLAGLILNGLELSGYLIPVAGFAVMIALLYDERLSLVASAFLTATIGLVADQGLTFIVVVGLGTVAAILSVHQLRDRRQLYRLLLYVPMVHLFTLGIMGMVSAMAFEEMLSDALYLVANPFIATGFALFAVPLSETVFGRCTNLTLLELLDLNRPLLRRLMLEAPGTYHHSLMVGTLAEAGASAIGANPLMARVQGYYHDIGKIRKPEYFIENLMAGRKNPHDKLAPTMSRLILESHVRDGLALAREQKLPKAVRDAIAQHHGTSLMTYFYHRAKQKDPQTSGTDYRYPGPRPRSRELAIVLLADQIDAASRSLEDPTPSRLRGLIKLLMAKRAQEGELDDSHVTLKDLAALGEAFIPILTALFHGRVSYPKMEQSRGRIPASAAAEPAAKAEG